MTSQAKTSTGLQGAARLLRYLAMPIFLGLACLALYLYVSSQNLDSIERRSLNPSAIIQQTGRLIELAGVSTIIVVVLGVTTGVLLTRPYTRRVTPFVIALANIGQAVPSIGLLALFALTWDFGFWPAIVALVAYSFLSILRNTMVGLQQVDSSIIEGARGLGEMINNAIRLDRTVVLITASGLTAILALFIDWLAGVAEDILRPRGL